MRRVATAAILGLAVAAAPAAAADENSPNMTYVESIPYEARNGTVPNYGTDIEFTTIAGRDYALAGSYRNGMHIVDIGDPDAPALSQGVVIDTTAPADRAIVSSFLDPSINVWHQSDPYRFTDEDGDEREYLIVEDEFAGAAGGPVCPSGGVHVFDVTGDLEREPKKVGYWNIDAASVTNDVAGTCTAHVFDLHEDAQVMTIAYYNGGVRVVDLAGLADGSGMREIGFYKSRNADSWSAKTPRIDPVTRDFHLYGNDMSRGLDVYRFDGQAEESATPGTWLGARAAAKLPKAKVKPADYRLV